MRPAISIDFGAAYTKIALREGTNNPTQLLTHETFRLDEDHVCIPTIVAWREADDRWIFGADAVDIKPADGIHVFRNWKPVLFMPPGEVLDPDSSIGRLFYYNLEGGRDDWPPIKKLAVKYFDWLLNSMLPALTNVNSLSEPLVRISIPEFAGENLYQYQMEEVLMEAGWANPWVFSEPEPLTNLVGALSQGKNSVIQDQGATVPDISEIFSGSGMINYLDLIAEREVEDAYNILLVDVGAYTTDFSIVSIDGSQGSGLPPLESRSEPYGIEMLDSLVRHGLSKEKAELIRSLNATEREIFRRTLYTEDRSWTINNIVIGEGEDREIVSKCIRGITTRISNEIEGFLDHLGMAKVDEVVLTGGGNNIPRFATAIAERLATRGVKTFHSTCLPESTEPIRNIRLGYRVSRASSALGGGSVLFGDE